MWFHKGDHAYNLDNAESIVYVGDTNLTFNMGTGSAMQSRTVTYATAADAANAYNGLIAALGQGQIYSG